MMPRFTTRSSASGCVAASDLVLPFTWAWPKRNVPTVSTTGWEAIVVAKSGLKPLTLSSVERK